MAEQNMAKVNEAMYGKQSPEQEAAAAKNMAEQSQLISHLTPSNLPPIAKTETTKPEDNTSQAQNEGNAETSGEVEHTDTNGSNEQQAQQTQQTEQTSEEQGITQGTEDNEPATTETEQPKTIRINGKDLTEEQILEAHGSILREETFTQKMQKLAEQEKEGLVRLNQAADIIDRDSVSQPLADMLTSNAEALTEVKEALKDKLGDKAVDALNNILQFDLKSFRHPLKDQIDKYKATEKETADLKALDEQLDKVSAENNLTIKGRKQLDDFTVDEFQKTGSKLTYQQALEIAKARNISIESTTNATSPTIEVIQNGEVTQTHAQATATADSADNVTTPSLITSTGSTPATSTSKTYKEGAAGDLAYAKDNNIDLSSLGIKI